MERYVSAKFALKDSCVASDNKVDLLADSVQMVGRETMLLIAGHRDANERDIDAVLRRCAMLERRQLVGLPPRTLRWLHGEGGGVLA